MFTTRHDSRLDDLARIELFRGCSRRELAAIASVTCPTSFGAGDELCREGTLGREAFVIVDGTAEVSVGGRVLAVLGAGEICGEMAVLDNAPRSATVTAVTPVEVFVLTPQEFTTLLNVAPTAARRIMARLSARLRKATADA